MKCCAIWKDLFCGKLVEIRHHRVCPPHANGRENNADDIIYLFLIKIIIIIRSQTDEKGDENGKRMEVKVGAHK